MNTANNSSDYDAGSFVGGGDFLKADDVKQSGPQAWQIAGVETAQFDGEKKPKLQLIIEGPDGQKKLTLNATNIQILIEAYGRRTGGWVGQKVGTYFDPNVSFGGKRTGGIRVKTPSQPVVVEKVEDDIPF